MPISFGNNQADLLPKQHLNVRLRMDNDKRASRQLASSAPVGTLRVSKTSASAAVSDTCIFAGCRPLPSPGRGLQLIHFLTFTSSNARAKMRTCRKRRRGHRWPLLALGPGNMPCGRDAPRSLNSILARPFGGFHCPIPLNF